jgi:hypothetical protein
MRLYSKHLKKTYANQMVKKLKKHEPKMMSKGFLINKKGKYWQLWVK